MARTCRRHRKFQQVLCLFKGFSSKVKCRLGLAARRTVRLQVVRGVVHSATINHTYQQGETRHANEWQAVCAASRWRLRRMLHTRSNSCECRPALPGHCCCLCLMTCSPRFKICMYAAAERQQRQPPGHTDSRQGPLTAIQHGGGGTTQLQTSSLKSSWKGSIVPDNMQYLNV
jgi:hypothetical protein